MTAATAITRQRDLPAWPKDALRIAFGVMWLIDAILKWLPGFRNGYMAMMKMAATGQPSWLHPWFSFWISLQQPRAAFFAYLCAILETLIAIAVIAGFARKYTYISAAVFSVLVWATAEGFGGPYTSGATDIGTAIIYAVVFMGLLALSAYAGPARYSVDYYLEKHISWWWKVAEVGRPASSASTIPEVTPVTPAPRQKVSA
jgi:nitrite reductase (NO-forming)